MREETELSLSELRRKREEPHHSQQTNGASHPPHEAQSEEIWAQSRPRSEQPLSTRFAVPDPRFSSDEEPIRLPFDPIRLLGALKRRWYLWMGVGALLLMGGILWTVFAQRSLVALQLMRREVPTLFRGGENGEGFKLQQYSEQTLAALVKTPEVLKRTAAKANPPVDAGKLYLNLTVLPERETDLVTLVLKGTSKPKDAANLLNLYADEFVRFTQEMQAKEAESMVAYVGEKLGKVEIELAVVDAEMKKLPAEARVVNSDKLTETLLTQLSELEIKYELARMDLEHNNPVSDNLQAARAELAGLLVKYTEAHPLVQDQQIKIKTLEAQLAKGGTNLIQFGASTGARTSDALLAQTQTLSKQSEQLRVLRDQVRNKLNGLSENSLNYAMIKSRFQFLEALRGQLASRQREAQLFAESALGYFRVFTPASADRVATKAHFRKGFLLSVVAAIFAMICTAALIVIVEIFDDRLKTAADVTRVTDLPVLGTMGDLNQMDAAAQNAWAFRTWTIIKGKLTGSQAQGMVCGFISATHGEGRTTWINLLIKTANQRGLRVLTVATKPTDEPPIHPHEAAEGSSEEEKPELVSTSTTLTPSAFSFPAQVTQQLNDPNAHSIVHIPLPGWVWNLERRGQWQTALDHWRQIENLVLLVELPPASEPESVLLAENVPQIIWLTDSGKATVQETRFHLETLRHAGCNMVGAVLNHEPSSFWNRHFVRRFGMSLLFLGLSFSSVQAQEVEEAAATNAVRAFSVTSPKQRAEWQKRLTLGPGDVLTLGFYGETNLTKNDVVIRPDGRISYLQAHDVVATGLTVDELREKFNQELSKYYRSPRVLVNPVAYHSKKYYVLGRVVLKGAFPLDRPMTIVEAVARARGLETGILNRNSMDLADLQRSFLIRQGRRVPVDFEKLFGGGDLSQNIPIEPDDLLYFPPSILKEVYVLGEVRTPGVVPYTADTSIVTAITDRGWFTTRAFKKHVLIVRGSLNEPETFVVDTWAMVDGRLPDFKLQPKDIVYVSSRPFIKAEELLDVAATSFIQSAVTAWTGGFVGPIFTKPFIPH
ncbi:MAG: polysaccharide biosynthesis/export family protein [Verrucomicrobiota bacterium]